MEPFGRHPAAPAQCALRLLLRRGQCECQQARCAPLSGWDACQVGDTAGGSNDAVFLLVGGSELRKLGNGRPRFLPPECRRSRRQLLHRIQPLSCVPMAEEMDQCLRGRRALFTLPAGTRCVIPLCGAGGRRRWESRATCTVGRSGGGSGSSTGESHLAECRPRSTSASFGAGCGGEAGFAAASSGKSSSLKRPSPAASILRPFRPVTGRANSGVRDRAPRSGGQRIPKSAQIRPLYLQTYQQT